MKQVWIRSALFDSIWIFCPIILPAIFVICFPAIFDRQSGDLSFFWWVILILLIDVAHVYSTIYRTYFNKTALKKYSRVFKLTPLICWMAGIFLYSLDSILFWRCLAYLAVFHFIRQQYGFLRIYSRKEILPKWAVIVHNFTIYAVTLLPIIIWHAQGQKNFNWFVEGDFMYFTSPLLVSILQLCFFILVIFFIACELYLYKRFKLFNIPRFLLVLGTALSWYTGIVIYNGDLIFTALNVIAHGIPYMALIWVSEKNQAQQNQAGIIKYFFKTYGVVLFAGLLFVFAWVEEGLWDALIWREHSQLFTWFYFLNPVHHPKLLIFLVPLLALPQVVHYVLDGFIWKVRKNEDGIII